jgi:branched-chain amino acid transport system substrate-binding protein
MGISRIAMVVTVVVVIIIAAIAGLVLRPTPLPTSSSTTQVASSSTQLNLRLLIDASASGVLGIQGSQVMLGSRRAVDEINNRNAVPGVTITPFYRDDQSTPSVALSNVMQAVEQDKVTAIAGVDYSPTVAAVKSYVNTHHIPLISPQTIADSILQNNTYIFRTLGSNAWVGMMQEKYLESIGVTKVAIIAQDDIAAQPAVFGFNQSASASAGRLNLVSVQYVPANALDLTSYLNNVKPLNPDALVIHVYTSAGLTLLQQIPAVGLNVRYVVGGGIVFNQYNTAATVGDAIVGTHAANGAIANESDSAYVNFVSKWVNETGQIPSAYGIAAYVAIYVVANAVKLAGSTQPEAIQSALLRLDLKLPFLPYNIRFNSCGDVETYRTIVDVWERGGPVFAKNLSNYHMRTVWISPANYPSAITCSK